MSALSQETLAAMTLARMSYFHIPAMRELYAEAGSFSAVIENHNNILDIAPTASPRLVNSLKNIGKLQERAAEEAEYVASHGIQALTIADESYPKRLLECADAPLVLFYCGNGNLNMKRVVNIVGTRHATQYADDCIRNLVEQIGTLCPELLIVSGLAYGVDIMAHRHSLENDIPTVGVLAHGLDNLYPPRHRETANRMVNNGGLLTEHFTNTNADKVNFVRRNRIVAGMSDATILVESAAHGGGLITCSMAKSYSRDVFAFPGRVGDKYSEGCNNLIRDNGAMLVTSAEDIVKAMGWDDDARLATARQKGIERNLFPELSEEAKAIVDALSKENDQQLNVLIANTGMAVGTMQAKLFELEMQGVVKPLAGSVYHLMK